MIHKAFNEDDFRQDKKKNKTHNIAKLFQYYRAFASLIILALGIYLWFGVVGYKGSDILALYKINNFDAVLRGVLAILLPTLGVGLWLGMKWSLILWGMITFCLSLFFSVMVEPGEILVFSLLSVGGLFIIYIVAISAYYFLKWQKEKNI